LSDREDLAEVRRRFAKEVLAAVRVENTVLEDAFATVSREHFLGPGPWQIQRFGVSLTYEPTPDGDPRHLYSNTLFGLIPERQLNNGQPSFHAALINNIAPKPGEHVVHIGAGVGYYTAILAHMVGDKGRVTGVEFEPELAARAKKNFEGQPNVEIIAGDGSLIALDTADIIYVNAGATRPADIWLDRLADGARLILPLTTDKNFLAEPGKIMPGCVFRIDRRGEDYLAKCISDVAIFPCAGSRDPVSERALADALSRGGAERVTRLYRTSDIPEDRCWLRAPGWSLAYD
jgi:protein-L-isoaspartate(D-aspartate) O-methyltransferase